MASKPKSVRDLEEVSSVELSIACQSCGRTYQEMAGTIMLNAAMGATNQCIRCDAASKESSAVVKVNRRK